MSLGLAGRQGVLLDDVIGFCDDVVAPSSVYALLHRERDRLFPDEFFADLFSDRGRRSVPPSVVATVMVLQRLEGLSDREAVERYTFDARWRYAAGVGGYDSGGWGRFAHTVLVDMRARLDASGDPKRIFGVCKEAASAAGLVGAGRVLDSTPLYDAVATMDTITLIRSAIRGLLRVVDDELGAELRSVITSGDDYATAAKPQIDWDDPESRDALIDSRARDALACLVVLEGRRLGSEVSEAGELLAKVVGQDLEETDDGTLRIARRVAKDRTISTVDPEARHGHKTAARGFDGYKGHIAIDPDTEIITDTVVSAGNAGDASVAEELIGDLIDDTATGDEAVARAEVANDGQDAMGASPGRRGGGGGRRRTANNKRTAQAARTRRAKARRAVRRAKLERRTPQSTKNIGAGRPVVYGDAAYGTGEFLDHLVEHDIDSRCKTQPPTTPGGRFAKDRFAINLDDDTVTCPAGVAVAIHRNTDGDGIAYFAGGCADCPLRARCTNAQGGRTIRVGRHEQRLADARRDQQHPEWVDDYRATRPKVERKLGHLMRRKHGGRRARVRGRRKVDADFNLLAAAHNLARLAVLGLHSTATGWAAAMP
ncbi:hypothetical protein BH24ACT15_BH24ACT15_35820 [soil metagenome]